MGFERDYEKHSRDKFWGKTIRAFEAKAAPDTFGPLVEKSLCHEMRCGELTSVCALAAMFRDAFQDEQNTVRSHSEVLHPTEPDVFDTFVRKCGYTPAEGFASQIVQQLCSKAAERLYDLAVDHEAFRETNARQATLQLLEDFASKYVRNRLSFLVQICARKTGENPMAVQERLRNAVETAQIGLVMGKAFDSPDQRIIAPRTRRKSDAIDLETSLINGELK